MPPLAGWRCGMRTWGLDTSYENSRWRGMKKRQNFFYLFLAEFLLKSEGLWKPLLDSLDAKKRIAWCGRSGTNSRDPEVKGMVELEIVIIIIIIIIIMIIMIYFFLFWKHSIIEPEDVTPHTFNDRVMPWTEYSLTVCCAFHLYQLGENYSLCTCGKPPYFIPAGTVSIRTLPEGTAQCALKLLSLIVWRE